MTKYKYTLFEMTPIDGLGEKGLQRFHIRVSYDENPFADGGIYYENRGFESWQLQGILDFFAKHNSDRHAPKCPHCNQPIESQ